MIPYIFIILIKPAVMVNEINPNLFPLGYRNVIDHRSPNMFEIFLASFQLRRLS